ncbi:hypothetical protein Vafri_9447, partial [Volvox africanus]
PPAFLFNTPPSPFSLPILFPPPPPPPPHTHQIPPQWSSPAPLPHLPLPKDVLSYVPPQTSSSSSFSLLHPPPILTKTYGKRTEVFLPSSDTASPAEYPISQTHGHRTPVLPRFHFPLRNCEGGGKWQCGSKPTSHVAGHPPSPSPSSSSLSSASTSTKNAPAPRSAAARRFASASCSARRFFA